MPASEPDPVEDPSDDPALDALIHRADLDGLVHAIDADCATGDWAGLLRLRDRARSAVGSGRQLWPAATLAEYRLALWAPAEWAAEVLDEDGGRFTIGPLTEVVAVHHTFADLAIFVPPGPRLGFIAHERALRGEEIDPDALAALGVPEVFDIPLQLQPWEPAYVLATYTDDGVTADPPPRPAGRPVAQPPRDDSPARTAPPGSVAQPPRDDSPVPVPAELDGGFDRIGTIRRPQGVHPQPNRHVEDRQRTAVELAPVVEDAAVELATRQLLDAWTASSNGRAEVVCVEGRAADAVARLGVRGAVLVPLDAREAFAWLAWAGASGGAHGRRRGAALGRFGAWWLVAALGDALEEWPLAPDDVGEIATELRWWWWDAGEPPLGWELQLAVEDPAEGYAWAISAHDAD
ncbi:MAG: hypothetical protein ABIR68_02880 [Ilumatobacteraceae bacterium]